MPDLIAQGPKLHHRWRRRLTDGEVVLLGREAGPFSVPWDNRVSRQHVELTLKSGTLHLQRLTEARNAVFVKGKDVTHAILHEGEHFVIGETTFRLVADRIGVSQQVSRPHREQVFPRDYLEQIPFRNARAQIEALAQLPQIISGAASESELYARLTSLLMSGVTRADAVALVRTRDSAAETGRIEILHWDNRATERGEFTPSERLIRTALEREESILHVWTATEGTKFTASHNADWAYCTPVLGEACRGWAIYVAGRFHESTPESSPSVAADDLNDELKFTEVLAATLRSLRELSRLERQHTGLRQFFSPIVLDSLAKQDPDTALRPRESDVTVLFCDLRGFSRESERSEDLLELLDRVSQALGVTTHQILQQGGVVGDFQGDAVMGFWGWPLEQQDAAARAARTALAIRAELVSPDRSEDDALSGFRLGIGIASGRAVAGKIGTTDQVKVTVFGPVVNLAARLETMTKTLRAPILLDESTADRIRELLGVETARVRCLATVRPAGLETPLVVSELLPAAENSSLSNEALASFEEAVREFTVGNWERAWELLHCVPADDRAKDFLTLLIAQHHRTPPDDWQGVIEL